MTRRRIILLFVAFIPLALALYAFWIEPSGIRVVSYEISPEGFSEQFASPLRIAVIADLHGGAPYIDEEKIEKVVALTNAAEPDLILLAGDYVIQGVVGGAHMPIETIVSKLRVLSAPLGVFAVIGNHDNWENGEHIRSEFEAAGISVLENEAAVIIHNDQMLNIVGLSDAFSTIPDIANALAGVPRNAATICLTHSPDIFPELPGMCALTIAGHTHGGQVLLPLVGRLVVPSRYGARYAIGVVKEHPKTLFVSPGIGTSILPVRFGVPPEISLLNVE
jgi:predicted MPP superfamily phosphohydrolase